MNPGSTILLNDVASAWSSWMLGMAWIIAVLVVVLSLITTLLRGRSASLLYALWLLVLIRLVLPPAFAFPTGWGWWVRSESAMASSTPSPESAPEQKPAATPNGGQSALAIVPAESPSSTNVPVGLVLMIAWLGIVAARCGMLLTAAIQVHVWVSRARPIFDPELLDLLEDCRNRVRVRRMVQLRNSEACSTPLVVGVWRPVLLLPSAVLDRLNVEQLRTVLIHELHHVRRWDGLVNLLQGVLGAVYFFHPAVWWANRQIRQLREDACDERTVAVLEGNRKPYGEAIFRVAEILGYSAPPLTLGVLDSTSPLTQRLRRILDPQLPVDPDRHWQTALILIVAVAVLLPAGARPAASNTNSERRTVSEAFSDSPLGSVKKNRIPQPRRDLAPTDELTSTEGVTQSGPVPPTEKVAPADEVPAAGEFTPAEDVAPPMPEKPEPPALSAAAQRTVEDLVHDLAVSSRRDTAVKTLVTLGSAVEPALLDALPAASSPTRTAIYDVLAGVGTERSILPLQQALQVRDSAEQRQIDRALDGIYGRMTVTVSELEPSVNSSRVFEAGNSSGQW